MRRGTTPTITITTDIDLTEASEIYVSFKQEDFCRYFEKTIDDLTVTSESISFTLTQTDTLKLVGGKTVDVQIRALIGDSAIASNIMKASAGAILKDGEI